MATVAIHKRRGNRQPALPWRLGVTARTVKPFAAALTVAGVVLLIPAGAGAQSSPQPFATWDGTNPFRCELQDVGTGTAFPDPEAAPFCVKFDKTSQNVTDFGLVDFLSKEPARIAAASDKCFYFQRDEWTGYVVQGEQPELWHWNGNYFFDKARGVGGVSARDFRVGGQPMSAMPFAPPAYQPYFDETGGGGVLTQMETISDPACAEMVDTPEERARVYEDESVVRGCIEPGGKLTRRKAGRARLGMTRARLHSRLGEPRETKRGTDRWCVIGAANLRIAYGGAGGQRATSARGGRVAVLIRTTVRGHTARGVGTGTPRGRADRRLGLTYRFQAGRTRVFEAGRSRGSLLAGIRGGRVRWLAIADPARRWAAVRRGVRRAR
jgi:hypothetical protein